jgi:hypothetical protein
MNEDDFEDFLGGEDEGEDINEIKEMFSQMLKSEVNITDASDLEITNSLEVFIEQLSNSFLLEDEIYGKAEIDLSKITNPLWLVIENSFILLYGKEITDLIFWYILHRVDEDGQIQPFVDEEEKEFIFNNEKEFLEYLKHKFPKFFE